LEILSTLTLPAFGWVPPLNLACSTDV
jgi:hypothetical protein